MNRYRLEKEDTVLMIIDLQEKLMAAMSEKAKIYKNNGILIDAARMFDIPVILTEQYPRGLGSTVDEIKSKLPADCHRLEKTRFSALTPEVADLLKKIGRKTVLITGSETHVCVFQTTRDLAEQGYNVHVVMDAVCSRFKENFQNGLSLMQEAGAVVTNTETVLFDLLIDASSPEFRGISALVK
ncbi:MAG: hydrolase [Syntrophomonas sp.]